MMEQPQQQRPEPYVKGIIYGEDARIGTWVDMMISKDVGAPGDPIITVPYVSFGYGHYDDKAELHLLAGVSYWNSSVNNIWCSLATAGSMTLDEQIFITGSFLEYPFKQLGISTVTCEVHEDNDVVIKQAENLGFKLAGVLPGTGDKQGKSDTLIMTLKPEDCRIWQRYLEKGYKNANTKAANAA